MSTRRKSGCFRAYLVRYCKWIFAQFKWHWKFLFETFQEEHTDPQIPQMLLLRYFHAVLLTIGSQRCSEGCDIDSFATRGSCFQQQLRQSLEHAAVTMHLVQS